MAQIKSRFVFPISPQEGDWEQELGITKREYFAAMAMQGLIANAPINNLSNYKEGVSLAIEWSDELLKQLEE